MLKIIRDKNDNKDFRLLVKYLDAELNSRYGIIQNNYNMYNSIEGIDTVVIAYDDENPIGCGCFKEFDNESVEIKRMLVKLEYRGSGVAKKILLEIEKWAVEKGYTQAVLETGQKQPEAIHFYHKLGYQTINNYGQYIGNSNSVCMSKSLNK
jgi:GNAT superfamily N-acetyltransferase